MPRHSIGAPACIHASSPPRLSGQRMTTGCNRARGARRRAPLPARKSRLERGPDSARIRAFVIPGAAQASSIQPRLAGQAGCSGPGPPRTATPAALAAGRSLTICCEATPVLAGRSFSQDADVAQLAEHDLARVGATSSRLVIRSMSGVSVHKRRSASVHVRVRAAGHVQRCAWCTGRRARGHSRHGSLSSPAVDSTSWRKGIAERLSRSSSGQGHRAFGDHGFDSRTGCHTGALGARAPRGATAMGGTRGPLLRNVLGACAAWSEMRQPISACVRSSAGRA
jgi:hypothetical protein